ncbi:Z1 domain-containing protein [Rhizobium sp. AU243]|uniref:Z1 domain-containing protein n=1 Tax=Rhizobium sp. AU243 TaxID=2303425 RepID=UPI0010CC6CDC|nr:Z1 domain-containing protein [Rhizobium sp. AU243]TKV76136.1 endonuclease [Rhizobium sp. AU243]
MTDTGLDNEKRLISALISVLASRDPPPTNSEVEQTARLLAPMIPFSGDLGNAILQTTIAIDTRMGRGVSIVNNDAPHDDQWLHRREIRWTYTDAYEAFLKQEGWAAPVVQSLSDTGGRILGHLQDPLSEGSWDRRGLVIGHVQSGKTANYMGVVAKAADAGYKFIIVIAGIHNNLRKQTQERIDEGFIGRSSDPENRISIGVGTFNQNYPHPATLTNINEDFNKITAAKSGWKLNDFSKPIILVIKKNVTTLKALHKWLSDLNSQNGQISDVPMLMIDDEADNASINTNKPDLDPTKTNAWIRQILSLFAKSCYVGYTATPFANIFINPDAYDDDARDELFPRDFIYSLDAPNTYFGPDKVFLSDDTSSKITKPILDCEDYIPESHKSGAAILELPPSLYGAIDQFIVARAIRNHRGQENKHCSMMINVSRFVSVQKTVRDIISVYEKKVREAVKANYAMPETVSAGNVHMAALRKAFDTEFSDCGVTWAEVKAKLNSVFDSLRLYVVNSKSDESLDYKKYERDGHGLTAIAVGGLSLSRGLTVEGLCISYMYRNTRMYDTLMQMGRWFGYRPGYEDLCRVYLSPDSIDWYGHIAEKAEELRQQIRRMRRDNLTPRQFGLYVETHPDRLLITAANKMRAGTIVTFQQSYSGRLLESYIVPANSSINADNESLIEEFWKNGFGGNAKATNKGWWVENADIGVIEEFLARFKTIGGSTDIKAGALSYLRETADRHPKGDVLLISVKGAGESELDFRLGAQERSSATKSPDEDSWRMSKNRVASRGDESIGLTSTQLDQALKLAEEYHDKDPKRSSKPSDTHYREVRDKPLLMIHVLGPVGLDNPADRVPAFGISFPFGDYLRTVEVVANKVWVDLMQGATSDSPDEEDDWDE